MEMTKSAASNGRQENRKQGTGTQRSWKAPGEELGVAKAKEDESPWIKKGGAPSSSARLAIPREDETGPVTLYHPTAIMGAARGPRLPSSISACCAKSLAQGHAHVWGSDSMANGGRDTLHIQLPMHKSTRYTSTQSAFLTANQCCGSVDLWFCCANPKG